MSVGEGILWSTVLLVVFASIYLVSRAHKWKVVTGGAILGHGSDDIVLSRAA